MKKKNRIWIYPFIVIGFVLILTNSCKKDEGNTIPKTVTDKDGNVYNTVTLGSQVWMAENLKTTKYNDGTTIPLVTDNTLWSASTTPAYCWFNNNIANKNDYGALYNWYSVNTGKLCPTGWHMPTDSEWTTMTSYLGGVIVAGGKLKEIGTAHWTSPNTGATDESGFTAVPGGYRDDGGVFARFGNDGYCWSATESDATNAWYRRMFYDSSDMLSSYNYKKYGYSVRCLRD